MASVTSLTLLERLRQPADQEAWSRFVDLYTPLLLCWAHKSGLQDQDATDLVQDVLIVLVKALPDFRYDPSRTFRGWLRTVAKNKWHENWRRSARQQHPTFDESFEPAESDNVQKFWEHEYRRYLVGQALEIMKVRFEPRTWQACWKLVVEGQTGAEVAAAIGMSEGAVYVAKSRVLKLLRQELDGLLD